MKKKYPFMYVPGTLYTKAEAIKNVENFIEGAKKQNCTEENFYLYFHEDRWSIYAESTKHGALGDLIKKFAMS